MRAAALLALCAAVAGAISTDETCDNDCIASRRPKEAMVHGNLGVPLSFGSGDLELRGVKNRSALNAESMRVGKTLHTSLLDADRVTSEVLSSNVLQSPTGQLALQGIASISGSVSYTTPKGVNFLEVGEGPGMQAGMPWREIYMERFDAGAADGWRVGSHGSDEEPATAEGHVSHCGDGNHFAGGHCRVAAHRLSKAVLGLPPHSQLRLQARFHFIDRWTGETAYAQVDGEYAWADAHTASARAGVNLCGNAEHGEHRMGTVVDVVLPHTDDAAEIAFGSTLGADPCEASFGVDDVVVSVR